MSFLLEWDKTGERFYETGNDRGVLYTKDSQSGNWLGEVWNGLTAVTESPSGADANDLYADNIKYASLRSAESLGGTIEAYMYPDTFAECDGSAVVGPGLKFGQQTRKPFCFSYRTDVGNDEDSTVDSDQGYKIHIIYNATASPSEKSYQTINESPEAITFSWEFTTTPMVVNGGTYKPVASIEIDSRTVKPAFLTALEKILYGTPAVEADVDNNIEAADAIPARCPLPEEILALYNDPSNN